jgi:hypothetical protein
MRHATILEWTTWLVILHAGILFSLAGPFAKGLASNKQLALLQVFR